MRFKRGSRRLWLGCLGLGLLVSLSGCARLGQREALEKLLQMKAGTDGCLNDAGRLSKEFLEGTADPRMIDAVFQCADDSIVMFQKFVRGSVEEGFTTQDIGALVTLFLVTNKPVSDSLLSAGFELKASVLGGSDRVMSRRDLDDVRTLLQVLRAEALAILPVLRARKFEPTPENLTLLADRIQGATSTFAETLDQLNQDPGPLVLKTAAQERARQILRWSTLEVLRREIGAILGLELPTRLVEWGRAAKEILLGGALEGIEPEFWGNGLRLSGRVVGPLAALASADFEAMHREWRAIPFTQGHATRLIQILGDTVKLHGGAIPLAQVDRVLDLLPDEILTAPRGKLMDRGVIKRAVRPIVRKIFLSKALQAWDSEAQRQLELQVGQWFHGQRLLEEIFGQLAEQGAEALGVDIDTLKRAAAALSAGLDPAGQRQVARLIWIAERYRPVYVGSDTQISFGKWSRYSLTQLSSFHLYRTLAELLLDRYSTVAGKRLATIENFKALFDDVLPLAGEMQLLDSKIPDLPLRRYIEANLFMFLSEGDAGISADEATYYIAFLNSIGVSSKRYIDVVNQECEHLGVDPYGQAYVDPKCFRSIYFDRHREWWDHFPETVRYYESLSPKERIGLLIAMERGARVKGYSEQPIGTYDMQGFTGVLHYLEAVFARYDMNGDQHLNLEETLRAFPAFKGELARFGGIDPNQTALLEAAFTYTVRFGAPPVLDAFGTTHFLMWWAWKPFWTLQADRMAIYKVIGVLSQPPQ